MDCYVCRIAKLYIVHNIQMPGLCKSHYWLRYNIIYSSLFNYDFNNNTL